MPEFRKVQLTGTTTLAVSLPKEWVKRYGVSKGTELAVSETNDGSLVVSAHKRGEKKKLEGGLELDGTQNPEEVRRKFLALYLAGFSIIRVSSKERISPELRRAVMSEARRLIGLEATDESQNEIIVQDFFSQEGLSISKTLNRTHLITSELYEELSRALKEGDAKLAQSVESRDDEVDRLRFLLLRQLNLALKDAVLLRQLGLTTADCLNYATIARSIERIADKISKISTLFRQACESKKGAPAALKKINSLNENALQAYLNAVLAFQEKNFALANSVIEQKAQLFAARDEIERELLRQSAPFEYGLIADTIAGIADDCAEIAETTIDQVQAQG